MIGILLILPALLFMLDLNAMLSLLTILPDNLFDTTLVDVDDEPFAFELESLVVQVNTLEIG